MTDTTTARPSLTVKQAAERMNTDPKTIRKLVKAGSLPSYRLTDAPKSPIRVKAEDLEAYMSRK